MKYADLIRAVLDGEEIQYKFNGNWNTFGHTKTAIQCLMNENPASEYRIKPEPKPDVVDFFGIGKYTGDRGHSHITGCYTQANFVPDVFSSGNFTYMTVAKIKFTINGETGEQTVEIVK